MIEENKTVDVAFGAKLEPLIQIAGYELYVPQNSPFITFLAKTCMAAERPPAIVS